MAKYVFDGLDITAEPNPSVGNYILAVDINDGLLKKKDSTGTIVDLEGGGGGTISGLTQNFIPKSNATGDNIVNSILYASTTALGLGTTTPHSSSILDITSTTKGVLFPRMTSAQRNAISSPAAGLIVYDTDINDFMHYDASINTSEWVSFGAKGMLVQHDSIQDINIPSGFTYISIGPDPVVGGVTGSGNYVNITGTQNQVLRFDANGYPTTSIIEIKNNGVINIPIFTSDPSNVSGDMWVLDSGGQSIFKINVNGTVKSVELT